MYTGRAEGGRAAADGRAAVVGGHAEDGLVAADGRAVAWPRWRAAGGGVAALAASIFF
uniref:Uncharacterized protein n=1 Tax=Oryza sativa subsp. japonica TaxID=39947 RepID=Q7EZC5_ORYSJ|nr:hypothetical protein [Oryza sativa Japonica Group]BAC99661.1 hypothetical protein [Oryza sativa Japonica Group]